MHLCKGYRLAVEKNISVSIKAEYLKSIASVTLIGSCSLGQRFIPLCVKMFSAKVVALLALTCVQKLVAAESKVRYSMTERFDDSIVNADLHHSLVSYITCDRSLEKSKTGWSAKKCNVSLGTVDEKGERKTCSLDFVDTMAITSFAIHAISAEKSVVVWADEDSTKPHYYLKFTIIHFPSCNVSEAKIDFENRKSLFNNIIRYENAFIPNKDGTFDVFFENTKYCSNKVCRLTLNSQAEFVKGPEPSYEPINRLFDATTELNPVDNTYVMYESRRDDFGRISLIKPDGRVILQEAGTEGSKNNDVSTLHDKIRVCKKIGDAKINCELFNTKGESVSKNDIEIGHKFNSFTLFNLPNDEYVLETESRKHAHVTKIGSDGKHIGTVKLPGYICRGAQATTVKDVYAGNNELCMARMCYSDSRIDVVQKCYDNADIK